MRSHRNSIRAWGAGPLMSGVLLVVLATGGARAQIASGLRSEGRDVVRVADSIYVAPGFGNTFLVTTPEGNVVIDTSNQRSAKAHKQKLTEISDAPVRYVIVTHAHEDHRGGIAEWKTPETEVIVHRRFEELLDYQALLRGFFAVRNRAQFGGGGSIAAVLDGDNHERAGERERDAERARSTGREPSGATIHFDDKYEFKLGGLTFEVHATPGETYDAVSVWIPELKAAFIGDNYYRSFPNIYTLRGTVPRWATDYIASLDKVLSWEPEIVLPSHGDPIQGREETRRALTHYRDAIKYVHDETVKGMNEGKDVFTLMREIKLPPELEIETTYGNLPWSIRGIYESYAGWFDGNPSNMYAEPVRSVYGDLVAIAGADAILKRADEKLTAGQAVPALHLADIVLESEPSHAEALDLRIRALESLHRASNNSNERGWLQYGVRGARERLGSGK